MLIVDLNNFARYPTIAIGYLKAVLAKDGCDVSVLSPLRHGINGVTREPKETLPLHVARKVNYALAQATGAVADKVRNVSSKVRSNLSTKKFPKIGDIFAGAQPENYDVVLVSTYLMYHSVCVEIGKRCEAAGVPLIVGGSYFADQEVAHSWLDLPGLHALICGEVEFETASITRTAIVGGDLSVFPGVRLPTGTGGPRAPLEQLDDLPFPDYSDFPWHMYPSRIIPMITGRGCGWGVCTFCSDVTSTAGRTYRSRSAENVLDEAEWQSNQLDTSLFAFTDLKLNSDLSVWEAITKQLASRVKSPRWIGSVHVGRQQPNGLDFTSLQHARRSGAVRLTTGLESGSQRVLDKWAKGTDLDEFSRFLHDAAKVGISIRVTMIHGAPGEQPVDVDASTEFLARHKHLIDRVSLNRFQLMIGPTFQRRHDDNPARNPNLIITDRNSRMATAEHQMTDQRTSAYFKATQRLLQEVHEVNRKKLPNVASAFDGVM